MGRGVTHEEGEGLLELGNLLLGKGISLLLLSSPVSPKSREFCQHEDLPLRGQTNAGLLADDRSLTMLLIVR